MELKHLKTFENFKVNLDQGDQQIDEFFSGVKRFFTDNYNEVIEDYVKDIQGDRTKLDDLKKALEEYYDAKPGVGSGSKTTRWEDSVKPLAKLLQNPRGGYTLQDTQAPDDLETLIARVVLKDPRVVKDENGVWKGGNWASGKGHSFGSGS